MLFEGRGGLCSLMFVDRTWLSQDRMIGLGTILNAVGILLGGLAGLTVAKQLSPKRQLLIKSLLGIFTVYVGLKMAWENINGSFGSVLKQIAIVLVSLVIGNLIGKLLCLQKGVSYLGRIATEKFASADTSKPNRFAEGFITCTLLFCVGPMAILGALEDGLQGKWQTLGIKAVMDGLATMAFVSSFGWGVILAVVPVVAYQGTITLLATHADSFLRNYGLIPSISATGGLLVSCIALIILEIRRVPLADYMPSLAVAPLLTWLWK
jgi:uncharacterized membrane protein YqgA involved in biofilm formation